MTFNGNMNNMMNGTMNNTNYMTQTSSQVNPFNMSGIVAMPGTSLRDTLNGQMLPQMVDQPISFD